MGAHLQVIKDNAIPGEADLPSRPPPRHGTRGSPHSRVGCGQSRETIPAPPLRVPTPTGPRPVWAGSGLAFGF